MESRARRDPGRDQIRITGRREGAVVVIEVSDTGPGFSEKARAHLFEAFQGSTRTGGTGLGLAIAAELVRAHGGEIRLVDGTIGATLRLTIPDRAVELAAHAARGRARLNGSVCACQSPAGAYSYGPRSQAASVARLFRATRKAPVAQLDRAPDYEFGGQEFEFSSGAPFS